MNEEKESIDWWGTVIGLGGGLALFFGLPATLVVCLFAQSWAPFWPVLALCFFGSMAFWYYEEASKVERLRLEREKRHFDEQRSLRTNAQGLVDDSKSLVKALPEKIQFAESSLDEAEEDFADGAFAPFWDDVERAVGSLAQFQNDVNAVKRNSDQHRKLLARIEIDQPEYLVKLDHLPDPRTTSKRLRMIVRKGQKDFQFATIYEQRKTNHILVEGFGSLASAITHMGDRIESSLNDLSDVITLSLKNQEDAFREGVEDISKALEEEGKERRKHEATQIEMLDNIQRKRRPISVGSPSLRDGDYKD